MNQEEYSRERNWQMQKSVPEEKAQLVIEGTKER